MIISITIFENYADQIKEYYSHTLSCYDKDVNIINSIKRQMKEWGWFDFLFFYGFYGFIVYGLYYLWIETPKIYPTAISYIIACIVVTAPLKTNYTKIGEKVSSFLAKGYEPILEKTYQFLNLIFPDSITKLIIGGVLLFVGVYVFIAVGFTSYYFIAPLFGF